MLIEKLGDGPYHTFLLHFQAPRRVQSSGEGIKKDRFHDFLKNFEAKLNKNGHLNGRRIYGRGIPPLYDFLFISDFVLQDTKNIFCQNYQASMVKMFIF